jgi:hypothetical protein
MIAMDFSRRWTRPAVAALGLTALALTAACNTAPQASSAAQPFAQAAAPATNQAGTPVVVSCEPHQRTLVRPVVVNGATISQVECVAAEGVVATAAQPQAFAPVPVNYQQAAPRRVVQQPVYSDIPDAQVVPVSTQTVRPVRTNQVVYDERPVKRTRSVAKSAIIIGSSAGVGAGVGAAVGGKKGALIGAAIGGGGATVWDQVTRRK